MSDTIAEARGRSHRPLNEETIEAVRRRIGIPERNSGRLHNESPPTDSFRHFAEAAGDDNPLFSDPRYAASSSWGAPLAPPGYLLTAGILRNQEW